MIIKPFEFEDARVKLTSPITIKKPYEWDNGKYFSYKYLT